MIEREFLVDGIGANASPELFQRRRESGEILDRRVRYQIDVPGGGNRSALSDRRERADHDEPDAMAVQDVHDGSGIERFRHRETSLPTPDLHRFCVSPFLDLSIPASALFWTTPRVELGEHLVMGIARNEVQAQIESGGL